MGKTGKCIVSFKTRFEAFLRLYNIVEHGKMFDETAPDFGIRKITQDKQEDVFLPIINVELEITRGTFSDVQNLMAREMEDGGLAMNTLCECDV